MDGGLAVMKSPLQKISGEQARMKRQWGYFKANSRDEMKALAARLSVVESLLTGSSAEHDSIHVPSGAEHADALFNPSACIACSSLLNNGRPVAVVEQIHTLHRG